MSYSMKQATADRCYCRIQDEETNLNDIANAIAILNAKIVRLRNEVGAIKNINVNRKDKSFKKSGLTLERQSSSCYEGKLDVKLDKLMILEKPNSYESIPINYRKIADEIINDETTKNNVLFDEELNGGEILRKIKKKKISKGVQCEPTMDSKRKRISLNCFKAETNIKDHESLKRHKKRKISKTNCHVNFDSRVQEAKEDEANTSIKIRPKVEKEIVQPFKKNLSVNDNFQTFTQGRMGGGAELRGNRLISDLNDKIILYKNAKFDAQNVKKRLDACIVELNEIIEDVSLIFPNTDMK